MKTFLILSAFYQMLDRDENTEYLVQPWLWVRTLYIGFDDVGSNPLGG